MKKRNSLFLLVILFMVPFQTYPQLFKKSKTVKVTVNQKQASIFVNGEIIGQGAAEVTIPKNDCVKIEAYMSGYLIQSVTYCNDKKATNRPPKSKYFELTKDQAYEASISGADIANIDIQIKIREGVTEEQAYKRLHQLINNYFDYIDVSDPKMGYLRTGWVLKSFTTSTIRTRVLVKKAFGDALTFKVKIISEKAYGTGVSAKADEKYEEWDRLLRKYEGIFDEIKSRI